MNIDPYMQRQKCRPMTLVSGNIRYMWILGVARGAKGWAGGPSPLHVDS